MRHTQNTYSCGSFGSSWMFILFPILFIFFFTRGNFHGFWWIWLLIFIPILFSGNNSRSRRHRAYKSYRQPETFVPIPIQTVNSVEPPKTSTLSATYCSNCGSQHNAGDRFCAACGTKF